MSITNITTLVILATLAAQSDHAPHGADMVYIQNGRIRLGVDLNSRYATTNFSFKITPVTTVPSPNW
jgi:hypothetical protein